MMKHYADMMWALESHADLPCRGFYNYMDNSMACARSNREWLEAYFHDVDRIIAIKAARDPSGVFKSRVPLPPASPAQAELGVDIGGTGANGSQRRRRALQAIQPAFRGASA